MISGNGFIHADNTEGQAAELRAPGAQPIEVFQEQT